MKTYPQLREFDKFTKSLLL